MAIEREQAIREHVIHREDHDRNRLKLRQLYGLVADRQNRLIANHCAGRHVLDAALAAETGQSPGRAQAAH